MKPLHLNLASRPYRDYRPVYAAVVVSSILIAVLALKNIETYYRYINETRSTRAEIAKLDGQTSAEHARTTAAEDQLRHIDVKSVNEETSFVNEQLAQRAFSWSELLERLEGVLDRDVRIRNIAPSFDKSGLVHLEFACESKKPEGMLDTIRRFQKDPHFANPFPHNQTTLDTGGTEFSLSVDFKPTIARVVKQ